MKKSRNILIYGASGYIGNALKEKLKIKNYEFSSVSSSFNINSKNDIKIKSYSDENIPKIILKKKSINLIFFLASQTSVKKSSQNKSKNLIESIKPLINLYEYSLENKIHLHIIFTSTITVFGSKNMNINKKTRVSPETTFDIHKSFFEQYLIFFAKTSKYFNYTILRLPNIYGPGKNSISKEEDRGILNKIISNSLKNNASIKVYGDGKYLRDFIFIDDLIELFILIIRKQSIFYDQTLNLYSIEKTFLKDFFINLQKNLKIFGIEKKITYSKWPSDAMAINKRSFQVDDKTIYKKYKWKPQIQLSEGILRSLNYYGKKYNS
tara:strand:+ start:369 stop:1337 length:969 start_codon:yes stop_codon:yes gene_type:complete